MICLILKKVFQQNEIEIIDKFTLFYSQIIQSIVSDGFTISRCPTRRIIGTRLNVLIATLLPLNS